MKYTITQYQEIYQEFTVEAESEEAAIEKFEDGEGELDESATVCQDSEIISVKESD